MAKITPIDIIKGVSSKFGGGNLKEYFATKRTNNKAQNDFSGLLKPPYGRKPFRAILNF